MPLPRSQSSTSSQSGSWIEWVPYVALPGFAVLAFAFGYFAGGPISERPEDWALFGDYVGGVAGWLFGLFGLLVLVDTWKLQATELRETRDELAKSAAAMEQQTFESALFRLISEKRETVAAMMVHGHGGATAIAHLKAEMLRELSGFETEDYRERLRIAFGFFLNKRASLVGQYFRQLYHLFRFIERSRLADDLKVEYAHMARAQLSSDELSLLFYNGLSTEGQKFKRLIETFGLLKHIRGEDLLNPSDASIGSLYERAAFRDSDDSTDG